MLKLAIPQDLLAIRLVCEVAAGCGAYALAFYCLHRDRLRAFGSLMRTLR